MQRVAHRTSDEIHELREAIRALIDQLREIHNALDDALGDTDTTHIEDEDLRDEEPVQWAAMKLAQVIDGLSRSAGLQRSLTIPEQRALHRALRRSAKQRD